MIDTDYTRLHITPLTPALLNTILPPSLLPKARNISYHSIQTFPEKAYGYVDLPAMDADNLKKKLNGTILKGTKVRIDKARAQKVVAPEPEEVLQPRREKQKRKRDELPGVDIGERNVKRGWTVPGKQKDKKFVKSKFTTEKECLFKTVLPPNKAVSVQEGKKNKKSKRKEAVVHEFEKTTKYATFLRGGAEEKAKGVREFVEEKGWVDEDGNIVEEVKKSRKVPKVKKISTEENDARDNTPGSDSSSEKENMEIGLPNPNGSHTAEESSSDDSTSEEDPEPNYIKSKEVAAPVVEVASSSDSSSEDSPSSAAEDEGDTTSDSSSDESGSSEAEEDPQSTVTSRPQSSSGPPLTIKIPESISSISIPTVHPLQALYKRPSNAPKPSTSFSFFGADQSEDDDIEVEVETTLQIPLTPFTQKDFEYRGIRSAAPTPDTSNVKRFIWPTEAETGDEDEDEDEDEEKAQASSPIRKGKDKAAEPESDFQKWFWENQGNVNRAWKRRRKVAAKEKRQRENRKRQDRAV